MSAGKRLDKDDPLTEHDIADRLARAAYRLLRIMQDVRQLPGDVMQDVQQSRYLPAGLLDDLAAELREWGAEPK